MAAGPTWGPFQAAVIGALTGGLLMIVARAFFDFDLVFYGVPVVLVGAPVGCALWVTRTRRPLPSYWLVLAWSVLGAVTGFPLGIGAFFSWCSLVRPPAGSDGSAAAGLVYVLLLMIVSATIIGSIIGVVVGVIKARGKRGRIYFSGRNPGEN